MNNEALDSHGDEVMLPLSPADKAFVLCLSLWGCAIWAVIGWTIYSKVTS